MDNDTKKLLGITDPNIKFNDHWLHSSRKHDVIRWKIIGQLTYKPKVLIIESN